MKIGALIVTTGLSKVSGVAALLSEVGAISAGQRMISAFQCAGVSTVGLVVGPENKKTERQLAQNGVIFLRCKEGTGFFQGLQQGLSFMRGKFRRVFVVPGDVPLFLPSTLQAMLQSPASLVVPETRHVNGYPLLLDDQAMEFLLAQPDYVTAETAIRQGALPLESVRVEDSGILLRSSDMRHRKLLIQNHNRQLSRPIAEVTLYNNAPLYDPRLSMLLHLVEDTHSVRDACSLMQISYSAAWNMLNRVEDELGFPLITRNRGGASGRGSDLTQKGKLLMEAYDQFSEHLNRYAQTLYGQFFDSFVDTP
ncbi:MAG: NTP transferase domain-containing protein [Oscillospiraceae bacterium]|nr:NTP transferase domain-containing protein [Oscillospiraceae bacterium]